MPKEKQKQETRIFSFDEKVKSMSAKEIIMSMVNGLKNPSTKIDMGTFGSVDAVKFLGLTVKETCYGCAAINTICNISGKKITPKAIDGCSNRADFVDSSKLFIRSFEEAIDHLRSGNIRLYNILAREEGFAEIKGKPYLILPLLLTDSYMDNLEPYIRLANYQDEKAK